MIAKLCGIIVLVLAMAFATVYGICIGHKEAKPSHENSAFGIAAALFVIGAVLLGWG